MTWPSQFGRWVAVIIPIVPNGPALVYLTANNPQKYEFAES